LQKNWCSLLRIQLITNQKSGQTCPREMKIKCFEELMCRIHNGSSWINHYIEESMGVLRLQKEMIQFINCSFSSSEKQESPPCRAIRLAESIWLVKLRNKTSHIHLNRMVVKQS
jgi:hypothetical protein